MPSLFLYLFFEKYIAVFVSVLGIVNGLTNAYLEFKIHEFINYPHYPQAI